MSVRAARAASPAPALSSSFTRGFAARLQKFATKVEKETEETFRGVVIELFSSIIADTPVDEGRARGNWQTTANSPASGTVDRLDNTGPVGSISAQETGQAIAQLAQTHFKIGDTAWLVNNLPYIGRLEYDHWSGQAPHGMVRKNIARVDQIMKDVVAGVVKP